VVLIDRQYESHTFLSVGINNFQSCYRGTRCILEKGCKNVGFIGYSDPVDTIRKRILGYKAAINELSPTTSPRVLYLKYNREDSFPLIKQFIIEEGVDGIVCATSALCNELIEVLDTLDTDIQRRLKIISYDDNRWLAYLKYPITVISQPVAEIGNAAVENLLQLIEQPNYACNIKRELLFGTTIIDRIG
jgi:LacI family transcriptional regulator